MGRPRASRWQPMVSVLTGIPVRRDIAMTGEITLRGGCADRRVKEKLLAALRQASSWSSSEGKWKDLAEIPTT